MTRLRNMAAVGIDIAANGGESGGGQRASSHDRRSETPPWRRRPATTASSAHRRDDPKLHSSPFRRSVGRLVIMAQTKYWCRFGSQVVCALACVIVIIALTSGFSGTSSYSRSRGSRSAHHSWGKQTAVSKKATAPVVHPRTSFYHIPSAEVRASLFKNGPVRLDRHRPREYDGSSDTSIEVEPMSDAVEALMTRRERKRRSDKFGRYLREVPQPPCDYQYDWQKSSFPSCNVVHESFEGEPVPFLINNGGWVDIFAIMEYDGAMRVLKSKRFMHEFTDRNFDRYRRDAVAMERLTFAPNVLNIYGFCGVTALVDYADGGDIENYIDDLSSQGSETGREESPEYETGQGSETGREESPEYETIQKEKLRIATQVLSSIAVMHNFDKEGQASISHTDISPYQFIKMDDGNFVLNDLNRARFIYWNPTEEKPCGFHVANNPGKWRAPEEYRYGSEDEKVDVYSAGNVIYYLLTERKPFDDEEQKDAKKKVMKGGRPHVPKRYRESTHPVDLALQRAMDMCWTHDPEDRPSAKMVATFLEEELRNINNKT